MKKLYAVFLLLFLFSYIHGKGSDTYFPGNIVSANGDAAMVTLLDVPAISGTALTGTAGIVIATATLVDSGTTYVNGAAGTSNQFTQITFPQNITCDTAFSTGESTASVSGTLTIRGYDCMGIYKTEALPVSTNSVSGNVAWATINSTVFSRFTISNTVVSSCTINLGTGYKLGIAGDIRNSSDVYKITQASVDVSTCAKIGGCVSAKYNTIDTSKIVVPDGSIDYILIYRNRKKYWGLDKQ